MTLACDDESTLRGACSNVCSACNGEHVAVNNRSDKGRKRRRKEEEEGERERRRLTQFLAVGFI
jgi:hypothetical protein